MPASEVMKLYRQHKLHSGKGGPVVKSKKQATAIQINMARREGHDIPEPRGSFQAGGTAPAPPPYTSTLVPTPEEQNRRMAQERAIAANTRARETADWHRSMRESASHPPWENLTGGPDPNDPAYAIGSLQAMTAAEQHRQGQEASMPFANRSRIVIEPQPQEPPPGVVRPGEGLVPPIQRTRSRGSFQAGGTAGGGDASGGAAAAGGVTGMAQSAGAAGAPVAEAGAGGQGKKFSLKFSPGRGGPNPWLAEFAGNVNAPLNRTFDEGLSLHEGGMVPETQPYTLHKGEEISDRLVPETGVYPLHAGETVFPKKVVDRYRRKGPERG